MSAVAAVRKPPPATIVLTPGEWATSWDGRPDRDVCFGLRLPSDQDESNARHDAADRAAEKFRGTDDLDSAEAEWNDAVMAALVGSCVCDPNDHRNDPEQLTHPIDSIRLALRSETIRRIYHHVERLKVEQSPSSIEADDADIGALGDFLLEYGCPPWLDEMAAQRVRRHARYILDEIEGED